MHQALDSQFGDAQGGSCVSLSDAILLLAHGGRLQPKDDGQLGVELWPLLALISKD